MSWSLNHLYCGCSGCFVLLSWNILTNPFRERLCIFESQQADYEINVHSPSNPLPILVNWSLVTSFFLYPSLSPIILVINVDYFRSACIRICLSEESSSNKPQCHDSPRVVIVALPSNITLGCTDLWPPPQCEKFAAENSFSLRVKQGNYMESWLEPICL